MLDLKFVRDNAERVSQMLCDRRMDLDLKPFLEVDEAKAKHPERNGRAQTPPQHCLGGNCSDQETTRDATERIEEMREVSQQIKTLDQQLAAIQQNFDDILMVIPNMPHHSVAVGSDERDNPVVKVWGKATRI